ncbi:DUF6115 domain-containing protein [Sporomusa malonica]|uniref:Uncharacterized protein n=1 Tax=Sporomusa malonica TaxID=112901 RepID=A0A1W2AZ86_9FIRM|nr:hypothetical protein [Sporomusa malonica]SMC65508.1 hypothetical protein SAMN04488500_106199 [Sporomusa malonica]
MLTNVIIFILAVLLLVFFLIYKKEMIMKMFALNVSTPANEFTQQIERTADSVVKRLEDEAEKIELLLDEAEAKISILSRQVEHANRIVEQLINLENKWVVAGQNKVALPDSNINDRATALGQYEIVKPFDKPDIIDRPVVKEPVNTNKKHQLIIAMADQGYNVTEIAKATGMGKGEIMLLLQLNKK